MRTGAAWLEPARMIVPMTAGRVIGTVTLAVTDRVYDAADVLVAEDFGLRAGAAVENARLYRAASQIARTLQTSLLPPPPARRAGRDSWRRRSIPPARASRSAATSTTSSPPARVSGTSSSATSRGKGAEAAAVTALARYTLRTAAARRRSPAAILRWVGEAMLDQDAAGGRYCTIACAHDRPGAFAAAADRGLRRAPAAGAAARGRHRRAVGSTGRCSGSCPTRNCTTAAPSCGRATRWCSTPTG